LREPGTCRLAFWHQPRFSAGPALGDAPDVAPLWNSRARVVVNGHEHNLQRFRRRDGLTQYGSPSGGRAVCSRCAARLKFSSSATAMK
jgi:hypothetical protein